MRLSGLRRVFHRPTSRRRNSFHILIQKLRWKDVGLVNETLVPFSGSTYLLHVALLFKFAPPLSYANTDILYKLQYYLHYKGPRFFFYRHSTSRAMEVTDKPRESHSFTVDRAKFAYACTHDLQPVYPGYLRRVIARNSHGHY